jgi:hypothetical protein
LNSAAVLPLSIVRTMARGGCHEKQPKDQYVLCLARYRSHAER